MGTGDTEQRRRPIAARGWGASRAAADWLIRREASPDAISAAGMVAGLLGGLCLILVPEGAGRLGWLAASVFALLRLIANMLDGMVAVGRGVASSLGELWNELPDRVSDTAILVGLGAAAGSWALGLAAALAAMATAYVRAVVQVAGAPADFSGPFAKQQRMAVVIALGLWCALSPAAWQPPELLRGALILLILGAMVTALRRLARAVPHLRAKR